MQISVLDVSRLKAVASHVSTFSCDTIVHFNLVPTISLFTLYSGILMPELFSLAISMNLRGAVPTITFFVSVAVLKFKL